MERQIAREVADAEARRKRAAIPTAKTEAQTKFDQDRLKKEIKDIEAKAKEKNQPRVRPLTESKAIETGANFISEGFLFCVTGGIIVFEWWRQGRKESNRRDEVKERLNGLEGRMERIENLLIEHTGNEAAKPAVPKVNDDKQQNRKQLEEPLKIKKSEAEDEARESLKSSPSKSAKS
jgi:optic atrophy 3 protein